MYMSIYMLLIKMLSKAITYFRKKKDCIQDSCIQGMQLYIAVQEPFYSIIKSII